MRRRTESGRYFEDSDDEPMSANPTSSSSSPAPLPTAALHSMLSGLAVNPSNLPNPGGMSSVPIPTGLDTPRQSFDDLKALDTSSASAPSGDLLPFQPVKAGRKGDGGGTANFTMSQLMAPNQHQHQKALANPTGLPPTPTGSGPLDTTPFNSSDGSGQVLTCVPLEKY